MKEGVFKKLSGMEITMFNLQKSGFLRIIVKNHFVQ
jgi:hypothetical protein